MIQDDCSHRERRPCIFAGSGVCGMKKHGWYIAAVAVISGLMMWETPASVRADQNTAETEVTQVIESSYRKSQKKTKVAEAAEATEEIVPAQVIEVGQAAEAADAGSTGEEAAAADAAAQAAEAEMSVRRQLVDYALQFVGRPYRAGGNDPHTGADCSGFVKYVMQHGAGISMNRSSREQAGQGRQISADQMQPGDLLFYASGSRINHVAMYIGDGQIVHASTERTGIKTSRWNYRTPVRIVSMIG